MAYGVGTLPFISIGFHIHDIMQLHLAFIQEFFSASFEYILGLQIVRKIDELVKY